MKKLVNFREALRLRQEKIKSLICVGLDPDPAKLPACMTTKSPYNAHLATDIAMWMIKEVDATAPFTSMYKTQKAYWEAFPGGAIALQTVISYIHLNYPDIVVFEDCKRGDIDRTQTCYRIAQLDIDGADGMNFSPYMGKDCMEFLVDSDNKGRALVGLAYTSNPKARETQDQIMADGRHYWEFIAATTLKWAEELGVMANAGLVMAAAYEFPKGSGQVYSDHLIQVRKIVGNNLWLLIPGVGTQGGYIKETVKTAFSGYGSMAINSSSAIIFASSEEDFAEAAGEKARQMYLAIAEALEIDKADLVPESLIVPGKQLETLKNCKGFYESAKNEKGEYVGPVVGYAKKYKAEAGVEKNMVGFVYLNFAKAEQISAVRNHFAGLIADNMKAARLKANVVLGAPMGGLLLAGDLGRVLKMRTVFAEKVVKVAADSINNVREESDLVIDRHDLSPGDEVIMVEDVVNNFSTTEKIKELIEVRGAKLVGIVCAFNRSGKHFWEGIPVISACDIQFDQYKQNAPQVVELIAAGKIVLKPKLAWGRLS